MLEYLQHRKKLSHNELAQLETSIKGFSGEMKFYDLVTTVNAAGKFLFDFLLINQGTECQIDCVHINNNTLTMYEVKNFSGDFFIHEDKWYLVSNKKEIRNPLIQLQRSEFLLRNLLKQKHPNLIIKAYLVFVHESFMLYQTPLGYPAVFPSQLTRFQQSITTNQTYISQQTKNITNTLTSLHIGESKYAKLPEFSYAELQKGILCSVNCGEFLQYSKQKLICTTCKQTKSIQTALTDAITEFRILFPDRKITTGQIYDWCKGLISKNTIQYYLFTNFNMIKNGKHSYYLPVNQ